ncbi:hypothetical protein LINGRAHAP2_LOCUS11699 [Linum grandiflorum]
MDRYLLSDRSLITSISGDDSWIESRRCWCSCPIIVVAGIHEADWWWLLDSSYMKEVVRDRQRGVDLDCGSCKRPIGRWGVLDVAGRRAGGDCVGNSRAAEQLNGKHTTAQVLGANIWRRTGYEDTTELPLRLQVSRLIRRSNSSAFLEFLLVHLVLLSFRLH